MRTNPSAFMSRLVIAAGTEFHQINTSIFMCHLTVNILITNISPINTAAVNNSPVNHNI